MKPFDSSIIFRIARKKLPAGSLQRIFSRSTRLVDYWAADQHCEETRRNPIERVRLLLDELDSNGYGDYARTAIDYMAHPLGGRFCDTSTSKSDKGTVAGEVMDATISLGHLAATIERSMADRHISDEEMVEIRAAARNVKVQLEQILDAAGVCESQTKGGHDDD